MSRTIVLACRQFIQTVLPKMGITATVVDPSDLKALERALEEHVVSLYFSESPTNPYLRQACAFSNSAWAAVLPQGVLPVLGFPMLTGETAALAVLGNVVTQVAF